MQKEHIIQTTTVTYEIWHARNQCIF